jgi:hypothetical protein
VDDLGDVDPVAGVFAVRGVFRWWVLGRAAGAEPEGLGVTVAAAGWGVFEGADLPC